MMISIMGDKEPRREGGLVPLLFWLCIWYLLAETVDRELLLPSPLSVGESFLALVGKGDFWKTLWYSFGRVSLGIFLGVALGAVLAFVAWYWKVIDWLIGPFLKTLQATPVVSFILLLLLWVKRDYVAVAVSMLMVAPILWLNIRRGFLETDPLLISFGQAYQFSRWKRIWLIYLPSVRPYFSAGLSNAIGLGWKSGIAAEVICQPPYGVGTEMSYSRLYLDTPQLFAWTLVVIVLSGGMERLLTK